MSVRLWLEQGRVLNSSEQPEPARKRFLRALELARLAEKEGARLQRIARLGGAEDRD